jgi:hypothetical protein
MAQGVLPYEYKEERDEGGQASLFLVAKSFKSVSSAVREVRLSFLREEPRLCQDLPEFLPVRLTQGHQGWTRVSSVKTDHIQGGF